jgi:hypothetical protein
LNLANRIAQIDALTAALKAPALVAHLNEHIAELTARLISANDEQTRGAIRALTALINLPEALQYERQGNAAALSEESDAA